MSAAEKLARVSGDFYPTPRWVVDAIIPHLPYPRRVFDPCCGTGELLYCFPDSEEHFGIEIDPVRAQEARDSAVGLYQPRIACADALVENEDHARREDDPDLLWGERWDLLVCNPPFAAVDAFLERAMRLVGHRRTVAVLARMSVLEPTKGRSAVLRSKPFDVYVLPERPRFRADTKGADSMTCVWLVAGPGRGGVIRWLDPRTSDDSGRPVRP